MEAKIKIYERWINEGLREGEHVRLSDIFNILELFITAPAWIVPYSMMEEARRNPRIRTKPVFGQTSPEYLLEQIEKINTAREYCREGSIRSSDLDRDELKVLRALADMGEDNEKYLGIAEGYKPRMRVLDDRLNCILPEFRKSGAWE